MESTKLNYKTWAMAIYMVTTNIKGISSMKLYKDLDTGSQVERGIAAP